MLVKYNFYILNTMDSLFLNVERCQDRFLLLI